MSPPKLRRPTRPSMRRAVILFPSGLTLFNLFFGIFAIITASRGDFYRAGVYVLLGGICDALDGRVARATNAGSQFGEELDSLVDAISFGLAPAMIMYFAVLDRDGWQWVFVFAFAACAVLRLARFNIEQAGTAKTYFSGLPSPAAGCTLASYYWFSHSWLYNYGAIGNLPWQEMLRFLMAALAALMISPIPYPVFPRTGWRSKRALAGTVLLLTSATLFLTNRLEFFFPLCLLYVAWGPLRWLISGLFERRQPTIPYDLSEGEDDEEEEDEEFEAATAKAAAARQSARDPRPPRDDPSKRHRVVEEAVAKAARTDERPPRADRPDRPQRTEAELAARKEKREKRDKRDARPERTPRPPRADIATVVLAPVVPIVEEPAGAMTSPLDPIDKADAGAEIGVISPASGGSEGAAPRKRKRRRRRGERKERNPGDGSAPSEVSTDGDAGDFDGDDGGDFGESEGAQAASPAAASNDSPYSHTPVTPPPVHVNTPAPDPVAAPPAPRVEQAPSPTPASEPHE